MNKKIQILTTLIFILFFKIIISQEDNSNPSVMIKFNHDKNLEANKLLTNIFVNDEIVKLEKIITNNSSEIYKLRFNTNLKLQETVSLLKNNEYIDCIEIDVLGRSQGSSEITPNDNQYYKQWSFKNNGNIPFTESKVGADIEMEKSWEIEKGDSNVVVAIIDSGIKSDHSEFNGRLWKNKLEIPNNGLDDDNNGYVDDYQGWNFTNETNIINDDSGHGTNIASIIGAKSNNGIGFTGMDWNCKLMVLKVTNNDVGYYSWWINSIYYAVNNGANVINMSLGGDVNSQLLNEAIQYALDRNVVFVVSMGNNNSDKISYPSNQPGVIAVGGTNPDDKRIKSFFWGPSNGSNYGDHISVVAPGNYIYGLSHDNNTDYNKYYGGTSQSAAFVSGLASLLIAQTPNITNSEIKKLIEENAEDNVGDLSEDKYGWDIYYGNGRINCFNTLNVNNINSLMSHEDNLKMYPNPTKGSVTISNLTSEKIILTSINGQLVKTYNNLNNNSIFIENLPSGVYMVTANQTTEKLIVE